MGMTLHSAIAAELPFLRAEAESMHVDTFTAYEPTGRTAQNETTGLEEPVYAARGSTRGKVAGKSREGDTQTRMVDIGGVEYPVIEGGLHLPLSATVPEVGWEYECTSVGSLSDVALLGRRWRVVDVPAKTYATARRLDVVEVS